MKSTYFLISVRNTFKTIALLFVIGYLTSCEDPYPLDDTQPDWLGASIYDYLKDNGNYNYYVRLIDDVGYTEVLQQTGSKTLFVANDSAFNEFFKNNPWGVSKYDQMSLAQKRILLNFGMINNAYLIETLSSYYNGIDLLEGKSIRQITASSVYDSIPFDFGDQIPNGTFWAPYKTKGIHILKDQTPWPSVFFLQKQLSNTGVSNEDFQLITGVTRNNNDAHVFDNKVVKRDITCKNGYVHVLQSVLFPKYNMAQFIEKNPDNSIFASLMDRYCAPYYFNDGTKEYINTHPGFTDSIFVKKYFALSSGGGATIYPNGKSINPSLLLNYDPGWNSYRYITSNASYALEIDMASMFVPTNDAIDDYFNNGNGRILKNRYGTWENIPDDILVLFIKRHMQNSYLESLPNRFDKLTDSENFKLHMDRPNIVDSYVGVNGIVYVINTVFPPPDYESVYAPVLFGEKAKIFNWAVINNDFRLYLNALESRFSFLVPTDDYFNNYLDPITFGKNIQGALKFFYNEKSFSVNATLYRYNTATKSIEDSITTITNSTFIANRLLDLLDTHIVIGDIESGKNYYFTKGGNILHVTGTGNAMKIEGGGDIELGTQANIKESFSLINGKTYYIDKPIQTSLRSVYSVLSTTPEFNEFFNLISGFPSSSSSVIFVKKKSYYGIDYNIRFFNTFNYTVYVPTDTALKSAYAAGKIKPWDSRPGIEGINDIADANLRNAEILKLERFLRYHFQDNSVFISGYPVNEIFATATIKNNDSITAFNTYRNKYYKLGISGDGSDLNLSTETYGNAKVVKTGGLYNILTRDYIFNDDPKAYKEIDGSGTGKEYNSSQIYTSSSAVIHQIDNILEYQK